MDDTGWGLATLGDTPAEHERTMQRMVRALTRANFTIINEYGMPQEGNPNRDFICEKLRKVCERIVNHAIRLRWIEVTDE